VHQYFAVDYIDSYLIFIDLHYVYLQKYHTTVALFNHKLALAELLREIPEDDITRIARDTRVDYCSKVLQGKLMFYLLLYGMLRIDRLSQRGLKDAFSSPLFRTIFNYHGQTEISHSSISERLTVIEVDFFRQVYELFYRRFSSLYSTREIEGLLLQRVDSTLVKDASGRLQQGLTCGNEYRKGKMLKYTINFDGMFATLGSIHHQECYASEALALPENVMNHFRKEKNHACVYILDRGQTSIEAYKKMKSEEGLLFVGRLIENRQIRLVKELPVEGVDFKYGELVQDAIVQLYKREVTVSRNGKESRRSVLVDETFRIIRFTPPGKDESILLMTNILHLSAEEIAQIYRYRWDLEVFFRFIKQELNFSHFLSLNENGLQVTLYMTMITAMLVMIYKKENEIGYKTAIRRMGIEIENLVLAIVVIQSGGDLRKTDLPAP
jgi:hypothetical protein